MKYKNPELVGLTGSTGLLGNALRKKITKDKKYKLNCFKGNITKKNELKKWFKNNEFDSLIHLAALVPTYKVVANQQLAKNVNILGTRNIIDEVNKKGSIKWVFFSSTAHVYEYQNKQVNENSKKLPFSLYGKTKLSGEKIILKNIKKDKKICIARIFSLTSASQDTSFFLPSIIKKIKKSNKIEGNFNQYRDFIHLDDVVEAIILLLSKKKFGVYNIASGKKIEFEKLIKKICYYLKKKIEINNKIVKNQKSLFGNISKITKEIKWKPKRTIEYIIKDYLN